jgi:phosphomannomutase
VRASNTEPIRRIVAEAKDEATANGLVAQVRKIADAIIAKK